jgi:lycopene beta-cyclase
MNNDKLIIAGGGLWGGLLAYALTIYRPEIEYQLYERGHQLGGNHTWCFHEADLGVEGMSFIRPLIHRSWEDYDVCFPGLKRRVALRYHALTSEQFHQVLSDRLPAHRLKLSTDYDMDGTADLVIDATGSRLRTAAAGYQKFLGIELKLARPHQLLRPVLMNACVEQREGFRFLYLLPFDSERILIEDTRYSLNPEFTPLMESELLAEVENLGLGEYQLLRQESGSLPIPLTEVLTAQPAGIINLAGIFHDTTGYSLPDAIRFILRLVKLPHLNHASILDLLQSYQSERRNHREYFRLLNRMLFHAAIPGQEYRVLQHFYTKSHPLISRFYAGELSGADKFRIFVGMPPVPIRNALKVFSDSLNNKVVIR